MQVDLIGGTDPRITRDNFLAKQQDYIGVTGVATSPFQPRLQAGFCRPHKLWHLLFLQTMRVVRTNSRPPWPC